MFLSVQPRYHIAAHRTGFQDKKLSIEDADHVAFKELAQRPYDQAVKEGVTNSLLQITAPAANNFLPTQRAFHMTSQMREALSLLRHLILGAQGHSKRPSASVTLSSPIRPSLAAPLTKQRYNALLDNRRLSERPVCSRERTFKACRHSR